MINNAKVVKTDVDLPSNGVIHWIDTVILPDARRRTTAAM